jgi:hypothetical protein
VSLGQVQRDIAEATVSGDTVKPEKVMGKDGKTRTASPKKSGRPPNVTGKAPKRAIVKRIDDHETDPETEDPFGDVPENIPAPPIGKLETYYHNDGVREMTGVYRPRLTKSESGQETVLDAYGNPAPAGLGDTFADPSIRKILANIASVADDAEQVREQFNELKAARKSHQIYTWAEVPTVSKLFDTIRDAAVKLTDHLRDAIPYAVCPDCSGARRGCKVCKGTGYWPRSECDVYPERFRKGAGS